MRLFLVSLIFGLLAVAMAGTKDSKSTPSAAVSPSTTAAPQAAQETTTSGKDKRQVHGTRTIQLATNPARSRYGPGRHNRYSGQPQYQQQQQKVQQQSGGEETIYGSGSAQQQQEEIPPEYLAYFQQQEKILQQQKQQQQQPQEYQVTDEVEQQDIQYIEPQQQPQPQYVTYKSGQQQVISEDEYLDLVRKSQEVERPQHAEEQAAQQYHQPNQLEKGPVQYTQQRKYQKYQSSPFGESSLEKEAARLEEENRKSLAEFQAEILAREQKQKHRQPHYQTQAQAQAQTQEIQHVTPQYNQKQLIAHQYLTEVQASEKASPLQAQHTRPYVQYQEAETQQTYKHQPQQHQRLYEGGPKVHYQQPAKVQYFQTSEQISVEQPEIGKARPNAVKIVEPPQLQYEKPAFHLRQYQKANQQAIPQAHALQRPGPQKYINAPQGVPPSRSSIFVSQGTGVKPSAQYNQGERQVERPERPRLPVTSHERPLTQEEFQALVDAGYKVTAIPVPVPVPVPADKYQQEQQKQKQRYAAQSRIRPQYVEKPGYRPHNIDIRLAAQESYARPFFKSPVSAPGGHLRPKN